MKPTAAILSFRDLAIWIERFTSAPEREASIEVDATQVTGEIPPFPVERKTSTSGSGRFRWEDLDGPGPFRSVSRPSRPGAVISETQVSGLTMGQCSQPTDSQSEHPA